ncbi:MAG: uroporphyrinogen decarboxylase family protein [Gemmatimonadota bacterium]
MPTPADKTRRLRQALDLQRPDRLPLAGDWRFCEYRPEVYHLGEPELVAEGEVRWSADGKRAYTRDGGVWAVGDRERFRGPEDVLAVDPDAIEVEEVGPAMLAEMDRLCRAAAATAYPCAWHYGTLVTRATLMFGWEPFLQAAALDPERFGLLCDRFGAASLAVASGWARTDGIEAVFVHDDLAATRGPILSPEWYRRYVFPWHGRIYDALRRAGRKAIYVCDGNYLPLLEDILALGPDGLYIESTSMDPAEFMGRAGRDKVYLLKSDSRNTDHGTPKDVWAEIRRIRQLHQEYPGILMYRGGSRKPECVHAFEEACRQLLVYT